MQQWLTDISATRAQDGLDDGFDEAEKSSQSFLQGLARFRDMCRDENDEEGLAAMASLETAFASYYEQGKAMAQAYISGGPSEGNKSMAAFDQAAVELAASLDPFLAQQVDEFDVAMAGIVSSVAFLRVSVLVAGLCAVVFSVLTAWAIITSIPFTM